MTRDGGTLAEVAPAVKIDHPSYFVVPPPLKRGSLVSGGFAAFQLDPGLDLDLDLDLDLILFIIRKRDCAIAQSPSYFLISAVQRFSQ